MKAVGDSETFRAVLRAFAGGAVPGTGAGANDDGRHPIWLDWRPPLPELQAPGGPEAGGAAASTSGEGAGGDGAAVSRVFSPLLAQLRTLAQWAERQSRWELVSCSVLLVYEGYAGGAGGKEGRGRECVGGAPPAVYLVDFAHTFPAEGGSAGERAGGNFAAGLRALVEALTPLEMPDLDSSMRQYIF